MADGTIRPARREDVPEILALIRELAEYERAPHEVVATEDQLATALFAGTDEGADLESGTPSGRPAAYCLVVEHDQADGRRLAGMALWFLNFSTWLGRHGVYLEDLYVRPALRGLGYGQALLARLAQECLDRGYGRLEWWVLDWNDPALGFYRALGAQPMDEWTVHRVTGDALAALASRSP
ncbi:MAG: GNAT family N-acetyltransferase [Candidatus Nanopelagicales bacterium]